MLDEARIQWLTEHGMAMAALAAQLADKPAIISDAGNRSFTELNANANRLVRYFRELGLQAGDGVAVLSANGPALIDVLYACMRGGFRLTPVNWHLPNDDIAYIVDNCEAKVFFTWGGRFDDAATYCVKENSRLLAKVAFAKPLTGFDNYADILATYAGDDIEDPVSGNLMLYTSGTTGRPKGVYRKRRPLTSPLATIINDTADFQSSTDVNLVTGPLYHSAPLGLNLLLPLAKGVTTVLMDKWDAETTLRMIDKYRVTIMHVVPTMLQRLLALPDDVKNKYDISSLRYVLHGAAPCPVNIKQQAMDWFGPIIYEYYAATEGGNVYCTPQQWLSRPGTVGKVTEGTTIRIVDDDGNEVESGEDGTIYFESPEEEDTRFSYFRDEEKTAGTYRGNYFTMGDIGHVDEDSYLFLTGRSAELVICGGVNVYPAQIDAVLSHYEAIADVATIGVDNDEFGEEIKAIVELKEGITPSKEIADSIMAFANEKLMGFMRPRSIEFVDQIPRSGGGKIQRRQLRDKYNKKTK